MWTSIIKNIKKGKMKIKLGEKEIEISGVEKCNLFMKFKGLMFCTRGKAKALLFEFKNPVKIKFHSLFVFFPFVAVWLDEKNKVIDFRVIKPFTWTISSEKKYKRLLEIPMNNLYRKIITSFVGDAKHLNMPRYNN